MIYDIVEIPDRYPYGVTIDTTRPMWFTNPMDTLMGIVGATVTMNHDFFKYKTLEFYGAVAVERILVSTVPMDIRTLMSMEDSTPVCLFTPHIKVYKTCNNQVICDVFRNANSCKELALILGFEGDTVPQGRVIADFLLNKYGYTNEQAEKYLDDLLSEGAHTPDWVMSHMELVEPHEIKRQIDGILTNNMGMTDTLSLLTATRPFFESTRLKKYMHPSYYMRRYSCSINLCEMPFNAEDEDCTYAVVPELRESLDIFIRGLTMAVSSDMCVKAMANPPWHSVTYAIHKSLGGVHNQHYVDGALDHMLYCMLEAAGWTEVTATKTWSEELFIEAKNKWGETEFIYIDLVVYGVCTPMLYQC